MDFESRKWQFDDAQSVLKHANNKKIADNLRNAFPYPYTLEAAENYVSSCVNNDESKQICRAIIVDGEAVGSIGIFIKDDVYSKSGELGYWLSEDYWGKGIMSNSVKQLCDEAFKNYDIVRIFAEPFAHNIGSRRVLEKSGFILEGVLKKSVFKNEKIYDSCIYALTK